MTSFFKRALATSALLPMVALANGPDFTENLEIILSSQGSVWDNFSGIHFYLGDVNDVTSAQARLRKKLSSVTSNYTLDVSIANRNANACGAGVYTSNFPSLLNDAATVAMSSDGREVVFSQTNPSNGAQHNYSASIDCGQSYLPLQLPGIGAYTVIGSSGENSIRNFDTGSSNGHMLYDQASNSAYIAYNVYNPSDTNIGTNTKLILARVSMPLKNITTYDLGNVRCSWNTGSGANAGGFVKMAMNDARQIFLYTDCGQEFRPSTFGAVINNMPEVIVFNAASGAVQQRMSIGGLSANLQSTRNGLVKAVATNGVDFFTLSDIAATGTNSGLPRIKRWTETTLGAGDFMASNSTASNTPFANISTTAANPYSDLRSIATLDANIAQYGVLIYGFDGVRLGSGFDGVDLVYSYPEGIAPNSLVDQFMWKTRVTGLSSTVSVLTTALTDYSRANFQALNLNMDAGIAWGNYFTFLGGAGLYASQARVVSGGSSQFPAFDAGIDTFDIS
jgi:hypothetical protein